MYVCMCRGRPCAAVVIRGNLMLFITFDVSLSRHTPLIVCVLSTILIIECLFFAGWCVLGGHWCVYTCWLCTPLLSPSLPPSPFLPLAVSRAPLVPLLTLQLLLAFPLSIATTLPMESGRKYGRRFGIQL